MIFKRNWAHFTVYECLLDIKKIINIGYKYLKPYCVLGMELNRIWGFSREV